MRGGARSQKAARYSLRDTIFTLHLADFPAFSLGWSWSCVDAIIFALQALATVLPGNGCARLGLPRLAAFLPGHRILSLAISGFSSGY
jgi:hypothetical protein